MSAVIVVATIKAKPGKEAAAEKLIRGFIPPTHREKGCEIYALHRSTTKPGEFVFIEKWIDAAALDSHLVSAHITEGFKKKDESIASLDVMTYESLPEGDPAKGTL